jgi:Lrp/AsnC family transcriptional regulator of ectoine degradation
MPTRRKSVDLDANDRKLLGLLHADGRASKVRLASMVNLSPTPCGLRMENLEKSGLIRGYHADVDLTLLANLTRFIVAVSIKQWTALRARRFEAAIAQIPNIIECEAVLGPVDYTMTVVATSISHYQQIMGRLLSMKIDEIDFTTYPVSKAIKRSVDVRLLCTMRAARAV